MHYLALCAIAKDEDRYLLEWIHYHILVGVERFIIYDNDSATPIAQTLAEYVKAGIVEVIPVSGKDRQIPAYAHCLREHGPRFRWIGFLDLDEFLVPKDTRDARILLSDYEDHGGLAVHWVMFGSSGHVTSPPGLQIENYTLRFATNDFHVKSIVQPAHVREAVNAHIFNYKSGSYCVNEDHLPVGSSISYPTAKRVQINHYWYRSQQDFAAKLQRGRADTEALNETTRGWQHFHTHLDQPHVKEGLLGDMARRIKLLARSGNAHVWAALCNRYSRPQELYQYVAQAYEAMEKGDLEAAEVIMCAASLKYGETVECLLFRASLCRLRKAWERAKNLVVKALAQEPSLTVYYELFLVHLQMGDRDRAERLQQFMERSLGTFGINDESWRQRLAQSRKLLKAANAGANP
ncbi:hypothetical protein PCS_02466 [Desulfocurvibacter africanus PCS]|uniref:Glycosyl transferase family 2 n=1 Tax=Desulfocurvibacter africanus PCS TaxID=1262666 RepID=M5PRR9_DESAF|nr:glycosyltransferase family 92 protein [Desulfocurvibacter africanus]EMG36770.1 hypothetical protein PCS_02466 [Desulfocurvibacter africanus PCS]